MPPRTTLETYLFRLRRCAEKGDNEGMLKNLQLAVSLALEENPERFSKVTPRTLLEILQAQNVLTRRKAELAKNDDSNDESLADYLNRLDDDEDTDGTIEETDE